MIIGKGCIKYIDLKFDEQDEFEANLESFGMKYKKDFIFIGSSRDNIVAKFFSSVYKYCFRSSYKGI